MKQPATPTLEAMSEIHPQSQAIGEFLEWLSTEKSIVLAEVHRHGPQCEGWDHEEGRFDPGSRPRCDFQDGDMHFASYSIEKLLAEFFEIDLNKAEQEKRALLDFVRRYNA